MKHVYYGITTEENSVFRKNSYLYMYILFPELKVQKHFVYMSLTGTPCMIRFVYVCHGHSSGVQV